MKKLKTGILIKDKVYIRILQKAIHTEYDQDILEMNSIKRWL